MAFNLFDYFTITNFLYLLGAYVGWIIGSIPFKIYQSNRSVMNELFAVKMMVYVNSLDEKRRELMSDIMEITENRPE